MKISSPPSPDRPHAYRPVKITTNAIPDGTRGFYDLANKPCGTCGGSAMTLPHLLYTPKRRVSLAAALAAIAAYEVPA